MKTRYNSPDAGGSWEHRSGDCPRHGTNIAFAKPYESREKYLCVQCMLACAQRIAAVADEVEPDYDTGRPWAR